MSEQLLADARALRLYAEQNEHQFPLARQALAVTAHTISGLTAPVVSLPVAAADVPPAARPNPLADYDAQELAAKLAAEDAAAEAAFESAHAKTDPAPEPALVKHAPAKAKHK
jgi:hypothetical protein